jgi:hypothetical protein
MPASVRPRIARESKRRRAVHTTVTYQLVAIGGKNGFTSRALVAVLRAELRILSDAPDSSRAPGRAVRKRPLDENRFS